MVCLFAHCNAGILPVAPGLAVLGIRAAVERTTIIIM